jgi:hypothetical protein
MKWEVYEVSQEETRAVVYIRLLLCRLWLLLPIYNLFLTQVFFGKSSGKKHSGKIRLSRKTLKTVLG